MSKLDKHTSTSKNSEGAKSGKDFCEIGEDSGFLSGPQDKYSTEFDSGVIDDASASSEEKRQSPKQHTDINFDSGIIEADMVESGNLTDQLSKINLSEPKPSKKVAPALSRDVLQKICYAQDDDGDTHLHISIITDTPDITAAIINIAPASHFLDIKNDYDQSPIHLAVLTGQSMIVRRLLIAGAKATIRDNKGNTPLHLAFMNGDISSVEAILAPISSEESNKFRLPHQPQQSQAYRRIPIDLEQRNYYGENCIHIAAEKNHTAILQHLIRAGADINARLSIRIIEGRTGYTALHIAVANQNEKLVKLLLECGSDKLNVETLTYGQLTPYQLAHSQSIMEQLERYGCEPLLPPESDSEDSDDSIDMDSDC